MLAELFILALLGHLAGDYLLQNNYLARTKSQPGRKGHIACTVHVLLYTTVVCLMVGTLDPWVWLVVAIPHWVIDRWSLAAKFMHLKDGVYPFDILKANETTYNPMDVWRVAFTAPVYIVTDNCVHLMMLYLTLKYMVLHA